MKTAYMHLRDGMPAQYYRAEHRVLIPTRAHPIRLELSLKRLKRQQEVSKQSDRSIGCVKSHYNYCRVAIESKEGK